MPRQRKTTVDPNAHALALLAELIESVRELAEAQRAATRAQREVSREQHTTNLIVRSQITSDPTEKQHLMDMARLRMDGARRQDVRQG